MRRLLLLIAAAHLALGAAWAQKIASTHIYADPCGAFWVDGLPYNKTATFLWPEGSKHTLTIEPFSYPATGVRCTSATSWTDLKGVAVGTLPTVVVTASSDVGGFKFTSSLQYLLTLTYYDPSGTRSPGTVNINGTAYTGSTELWLDANGAVAVQVFPSPGYVFTGWGGALAQGSQAFLLNLTLTAPVVLQPLFQPAVGVSLTTSPAGLKLLADRTVVQTPARLEWAVASKHAIAPVSPQQDAIGALWVWDSWSDGGTKSHDYTVSPDYLPDAITANFAPAVRAGFTTVPAGLKLVVDGRDNWPNYNFVWKLGSTHTVAAPAEQTGGNGRKYTFRAWSGGDTAQQDFVADGSRSGLIASYDVLGQLKVQAAPTDVTMTVDGAPCATPCVIDRRAGAQVKIAAPVSLPQGDGARLDFQGWADGGPRERSWTAGSDAQAIVAGYQASYRLTAGAEPPEAAVLRVEPTSPDSFYAADSEVRLTVEPKSGFRFRGWAGDLSGALKSAVVRTNGPVSVRAVLEKIPYVPPAGVRNAVGETPETAVAPGSIVTVFGGSLAPAYAKGPDTPLAQAISGVTVQVGDRVLPLFFVSPEQINAQLPSDLAEGDYTITVRGDNQPDVSAKFSVQRNAPGLFTRTVDSRPFALASHEDGSAITLDSRARRGETITLLGTGFGPYETPPPDGFAVPQDYSLNLADPLEILAADSVLPAVSAMAAPGYIGITTVKLKIADSLPRGEVIELVVRVNGKESNKALLPLE